VSRRTPRRARRQRTEEAPALAFLGLPNNTPTDVRDLARLVAAEGPRLLAGLDPTRVGLAAVHPRSPACPDDLAAAGEMFITIEAINEIEALARRLNLAARQRPGWFGCLLVGAKTSGFVHLAPADRATPARAS